MAYLYAQFTNQVDNYCEFSEMPNCNKDLIKFGISKLHAMPDEHLDRMDPYQRGANNISKYLSIKVKFVKTKIIYFLFVLSFVNKTQNAKVLLIYKTIKISFCLPHM